MGRNTKCKPVNVCIAVFLFCLSIRFVEYFLIQTDKTAIGEWSDIGFQKEGFACGVLKGLLLGTVCFAISYGIEFAILALQGNPAHFELYISGFSLTGSPIKNTGFVFFALCVLFNIVNVWMEEGVFRGLFIKLLSETKPFMAANLIAAFLFGIWHIVMPIRSYIDGEVSFGAMAFMSIGYVILAGIMGVKWGNAIKLSAPKEPRYRAGR